MEAAWADGESAAGSAIVAVSVVGRSGKRMFFLSVRGRTLLNKWVSIPNW